MKMNVSNNEEKVNLNIIWKRENEAKELKYKGKIESYLFDY